MKTSNGWPESAVLDSDLLRTFLAICDAGSFSAGARDVGRTQSAVSLQIKRLEGLLGQSLFVRHSRGVALTAPGRQLAESASRIVAQLDATRDALRIGDLEGTVRVGVPEEYDRVLLSRAIRQFSMAFPRVEVSVTCAPSVSFPRAVETRDLDIAVYDVERLQPGQELLRRERARWAGSWDSSLGSAVECCDPVPLALFDRACWWRERALAALDAAGRRYRVSCTSESATGVVAAIEAGIAVGLVGQSMWRDTLRPLGPETGFPDMPESLLVLDCRADPGSPVVRAMGAAIRAAIVPGVDMTRLDGTVME